MEGAGRPVLAGEATSAEGSRCGTILALHGLMESAATLARTAQAWARSGWDVLAPDLRGHGRSPRWDPGDAEHPGDRMVRDVLSVLDEIPVGAGPISVVGHSAGAAIAAAVAAARIDRVATVMLEDPFWRLPVMRTQDPAVARQAAADLAYRQQLPHAELVAHGRTQHPLWSEWEVQQWARAQQQADIPLVRNGNVIPTEPWPSLVSALTARAPVLVITGAGPHVGMTSCHQRVLTERGARVVIIDGANHFVRKDRPQEFERLTINWLRRHGRGSRERGR